MKWDDLDYWTSGECQVVMERLADLIAAKIPWCPGKIDKLFSNTQAVPFDKVRVIIVGQDPYPDPQYATGHAFSIPKDNDDFPPTLMNIFNEYIQDLGYDTFPETGDLSPWIKQGVLLWNIIPSCTAEKSMSHDWGEYYPLSEEVFKKLSAGDEYRVFVLLGGLARQFSKFVNTDECGLIETSHPSPRGSINAREPFNGSRIFSRVNDLLCSHGEKQIQWRLP